MNTDLTAAPAGIFSLSGRHNREVDIHCGTKFPAKVNYNLRNPHLIRWNLKVPNRGGDSLITF